MWRAPDVWTLVETSGSTRGAAPAPPVFSYSISSADTTSRGLPPISTLKSPGPRPRAIPPPRSTTVASTITTFTSARNCARTTTPAAIDAAAHAAPASQRRRRSALRRTIALPRPHVAALAGLDLQRPPAPVGRRRGHVGQDVLVR